MDELGRDLADDAGEMVSESVPSTTPDLRKRRSTRIVQAVPLTVTGVDALGRPFNERTSTLIINCHGCRYQSKHYVLKNMWVTLEVPHPESGESARTVRGRVAWIQRPRTVRQLFQVALELELPGNVWGIGFPPEDWFAFPEAEQAQAAAAAAASAGIARRGVSVEPARETQSEPSERHVESGSPIDFHLPLGETEIPHLGSAQKVHEFPAPESTTDASLQLARQLTRLLAEARQQIHASAREAAAQAVSAERRLSSEDWEQRVAAWRETLSHELTEAVSKIQQESVNRSRAAQNAAIEALQSDLPRWLAPQLEELTRDLTAQLSQEALTQQNKVGQQFSGAMQTLQSVCQDAEEVASRLREGASHADAQLAHRTDASIRALEDASRQREQSLATTLDSVRTSATEIQQQIASTLQSAQTAWREYLTGEMEATEARAQIGIDNTLSAAQAQAAGSLNEHANSLLTQFQEEAIRAAAAARKSAEESIAESEHRLASLRESVHAQAERMEASLARAIEFSSRFEHFSHRLDTAQQQALSDFQSQVDDVLSLHRNELHRRSEALFEELNSRIQAAFTESSNHSLAQFAQQIESTLQPHVSRADEAIQRLAGGRSMLDAVTTLQQERIRGIADEAFAVALAEFRNNLGTVEQMLRDSADTVTARTLADLESRAESAKHQVVEDLLKSAEWYEKKAQTQIQHFADKAGEQAATLLREKAAEVSSVFAGELNHASRNFVGHAQNQMEEVVRDSFERARALFSDAADTTSAAFIDEIQRQARNELGGFEAEVQRTSSVTRSQLDAAHADLTQKLTAEQENFLLRFQGAMQGALDSGINEVNQRVQAGFGPLLESWKSITQAHQQEMRELYAQAAEHAAEQYRGRLENVSNQWMLATVASFDRQSRDVVAGIAANAEERLRQTCTDVFSDIGEALRERLRQIAANFSPAQTST
jgi:hypothetical protein